MSTRRSIFRFQAASGLLQKPQPKNEQSKFRQTPTPFGKTTMKNIVILISGRGSNMQAIVNANIPNARIAAVLSNNPEAAGLAWAAERAIKISPAAPILTVP